MSNANELQKNKSSEFLSSLKEALEAEVDAQAIDLNVMEGRARIIRIENRSEHYVITAKAENVSERKTLMKM